MPIWHSSSGSVKILILSLEQGFELNDNILEMVSGTKNKDTEVLKLEKVKCPYSFILCFLSLDRAIL